MLAHWAVIADYVPCLDLRETNESTSHCRAETHPS
jgi:hypothetical protein